MTIAEVPSLPDASCAAPGSRWADRLFAAIDGRDWRALEALLDPNATYERPGYAPLVGAEEIMYFYRHVRIIRSGRHEVHGVIEGRNMLNHYGRFQGLAKDGTPLDVLFCDVCQVSSGLLRHRRTFFYVPAI
jgi:uncharacterized protein